MKQYLTNICFGLDINILVNIFGKVKGGKVTIFGGLELNREFDEIRFI